MRRRLELALAAVVLLVAGDAAAQIRCGSYPGSGAVHSISGVGFRPDFVLIKSASSTARAVARTSSMVGDLSKEMVSAIAASSGLIASLDADGFTVTGDARVNLAGTDYYWVAVKTVAGESAVGSYAGDGSGARNVLGLGFPPAYVVVLPVAARTVYQRSSPMPAGISFDFDVSSGDTNRIQALLSDGFQVGNDPDVNGNGLVYHYVAWKAVAGKMAVGSYVGDGVDNRSIAGAGFPPAYAIVKRNGASGAAHKPASTGTAADLSLLFNFSLPQTDAIQALGASGFQVGTQPRVNQPGDSYYWMAFGPRPTADLEIAKSDGLLTAVPGTSISYTITVTNHGPDTISSLFVNDSLPGGLSGVTFAPASGSYNTTTGEWVSLSLAATQSVQLAVSGTIDAFARGSLLNTATVSPPSGTDDLNALNDSASDSDTLDPSVAVKVVKTDDIDPAPLGGLVTYTLTVTNNGPSGATNVSVQDPLPLDMELDTAALAITPSQGTCSYDGPTRTVSCALGSLAALSPVTVAIKVHPRALRTFVNTASITFTEPDPDASDDSAVETTTAEVSSLGVRVLTATSTSQRNVLEWINPTDADYVSTEIVVRGDRFPTGPGDGATIYLSGAGGSGGRVKFTHATGALSNGQTFYYGAFVHRAVAPLLSPGRFCSGRPFDHAPGPVKWAFSTGATALAAPTVGGSGVIATSNDKLLYSMERGPVAPGGEWPTSFVPIDVGGPVQSRSPVVPVTVSSTNPVVYVGSQDGSIYTIDATAGGNVPYLWVAPIGPMLQAAPAGIFSAFNGATLDYILVGTRDGAGPNAFVALDPYTGVEIDRWDNGGAGPGEIGIVNGMAAVDYGPPAPPRVYFTNYERTPVGSTLTLRCFELQATPPVFNQIWARALGNIDSSPVLRGGRVYVGSPLGGGTVYSIDALDGNNTLLDRTFVHGNGQVKGFVFPDRTSNDVYFATDDFVWGVTDNAGGMVDKFASGISLGATVKPSPVLFVPGSHYVYVGGSDGKLYELDVLGAPGIKSVMLGDGLATVGAPSLDRDYNLIHVGSEAGIFYAVQIPLP